MKYYFLHINAMLVSNWAAVNLNICWATAFRSYSQQEFLVMIVVGVLWMISCLDFGLSLSTLHRLTLVLSSSAPCQQWQGEGMILKAMGSYLKMTMIYSFCGDSVKLKVEGYGETWDIRFVSHLGFNFRDTVHKQVPRPTESAPIGDPCTLTWSYTHTG